MTMIVTIESCSIYRISYNHHWDHDTLFLQDVFDTIYYSVSNISLFWIMLKAKMLQWIFCSNLFISVQCNLFNPDPACSWTNTQLKCATRTLKTKRLRSGRARCSMLSWMLLCPWPSGVEDGGLLLIVLKVQKGGGKIDGLKDAAWSMKYLNSALKRFSSCLVVVGAYKRSVEGAMLLTHISWKKM